MAIQNSRSDATEISTGNADAIGGTVAVKPGSAPTPGGQDAQAERLFSKSIVISGIRCLFTYLILPFVTPFIGLAPGVGAGFGLIIGIVAIAANVFSIRRFWRADHRWKLPVTVLHVCVIGLLVVLAIRDLLELIG